MSFLFPVEETEEEERLQLLYDRLAARFDLGTAKVCLSRRKLTGGEITYGAPHRITISAHLSRTEREDTLLHEAAHAWAYRIQGARAAGHDRVFRRLARHLGAREGHAPLTAALAEFRRKSRILYRCDGCRRLLRRFRPFRGARFCVTCDRAGRPSRLSRLA